MKTRLDLASYGVQEMTVAEVQEVNGGLSEVVRWLVETVSYLIHKPRTPQPMPDHIYRQSMGGTLWNTGMIGIA